MVRGYSSALTGIASRIASFDRGAARIATPGDPTLDRDVVQSIDDSDGLKANVAVARTADEMVGTLIDIVA
jgi:hypothetical protein